MTFILKKKRYKFQVDLCIEELQEVSYSKAILFAKIRQMDGGTFTDLSKRVEVKDHRASFANQFLFPCKMYANISSGVLEACKCRVSMRLEEKGGKNFRKLGFVDVNLAEYAGAGPSTQRYILQPYDQNHRLDNSILQISINIILKEGDTIFQRPLTRQQPISLPGEESPESGDASKNFPGFQKVTDHSTSMPVPGLATQENLVLSHPGSSSPFIAMRNSCSNLTNDQCLGQGHTRTSSDKSQTSQGSAGYISQQSNQLMSSGGGALTSLSLAQSHSRQSSSGSTSSHARNLSQGSSDTGFFGGSLEKEKKRRQQQLNEGRIDAESVIDELMKGVDLKKVEQEDEAETSGLQLYVGKDGTVTFDKRQSTHNSDFQPVVVKGPKIPQ